MRPKQQIIFLLSVDTEEEWDWSGPFPEESFSVDNLHELSGFQYFCEDIGIRPCYFVDYPAAKSLDKHEDFLSSITQAKCEIGAHLHPWANPPFFEKPNDANSHVVNLPIEQVSAKLIELLKVLQENINCSPKAFRTGRWGISESIIELLHLHGFDIDSSVYPFYRNEYFHCEGSPLKPYWPASNGVLAEGEQRNILEMPVTVGFNRASFSLASRVHKACQTTLLSSIKMTAMLWHTKLLRKIYFSPEVASSEDMVALAEASINSGNRYLHMYLHSSSLLDNRTGFLKAQNAHALIQTRISEVVKHLQNRYQVSFMTPSEYKVLINTSQEKTAV